jgi:hypothetical protein
MVGFYDPATDSKTNTAAVILRAGVQTLEHLKDEFFITLIESNAVVLNNKSDNLIVIVVCSRITDQLRISTLDDL